MEEAYIYLLFQFCKLLVAILAKVFALLAVSQTVEFFIEITKIFICLFHFLFLKIFHCLARIGYILWMQNLKKLS